MNKTVRIFLLPTLSIFFSLSFLFLCANPLKTSAQSATPTETVTDLQSKIASSTNAISELQAEIAADQTQINTTDAQAKTLQGTINSLNLTAKKLTAEVTVTKDQINTANLTLQQLGIEIAQKGANVAQDKQAIAQAVQDLNKSDSVSLLEVFLTYDNIGTFWDDVANLDQVQNGIVSNAEDLKQSEADLTTEQTQKTAEKKKLVTLQSSLIDQQKEVAINQQTEATLLAQTKDKESNYEALLKQKEAAEASFENDLNNFQAQLKLVIDPNSLPATGQAEFAWPVAGPIRITQLFGDTAFSREYPLVYDGNGHSGLDIAASLGTPVMAVADGTVMGTGNTDLTCPGASYGNWVFIKHNDGLSSLYAHLSLIKATKGQQVTTGEVIGYSGETGYATGPHLHLGVFASEGVEVTQVPSQGCKGHTYTMPAGDLKAYLNPLLYLPTTGYTILPGA